MAGVVAGLLIAPKSGEETRRALKAAYARRTEEEVLEKAKEARAALDPDYWRVASISARRKRRMSRRAVEAGRETMKRKKMGYKCCS